MFQDVPRSTMSDQTFLSIHPVTKEHQVSTALMLKDEQQEPQGTASQYALQKNIYVCQKAHFQPIHDV